MLHFYLHPQFLAQALGRQNTATILVLEVQRRVMCQTASQLKICRRSNWTSNWKELDQNRGYAQGNLPTDTSNPYTQSYQWQGSHKNAYLATGAAAGLGAGAFASRRADGRHENKTDTTSTNEEISSRFQPGQSGTGTATGNNTASGYGKDKSNPLTDSHDQPVQHDNHKLPSLT